MQGQSKADVWSQALVEVTTYLRSLSVFVFLGIGGMAIAQYPSIAFPPSPLIALYLGVVLVIVAIGLSVWLAIDTVRRLIHANRNGFIVFVTLVLVLMPTTCIVSAQIAAGAYALKRAPAVDNR